MTARQIAFATILASGILLHSQPVHTPFLIDASDSLSRGPASADSSAALPKEIENVLKWFPEDQRSALRHYAGLMSNISGGQNTSIVEHHAKLLKGP